MYLVIRNSNNSIMLRKPYKFMKDLKEVVVMPKCNLYILGNTFMYTNNSFLF